MYFTREEIRTDLTIHREQIESATCQDGLLTEWADSYLPVYNSDIIRDWVELPGEDSDRWKEYGYDANRNEGGIVELMKLDLWFYYHDLTHEIWREITGKGEDD